MSKVSSTGKQHVQMHRKLKQRKTLLDALVKLNEGKSMNAYVPFIGDGDIANELYTDYGIYGADLDPERVATAKSRFPTADIRIADCDKWSFSDIDAEIDICDFDSYSNPYPSFTSFWAQHENKADRMMLMFTDGWKQSIYRSGTALNIDTMKTYQITDTNEKRKIGSKWYKTAVDYVSKLIEPYHIVEIKYYTRDASMIYWGIVISNDSNDKRTSNANLNKPQSKKQFLKLISTGMSVTAAANQIGRNRPTMYAWRNDDPDFAQAWEDAVNQGTDVYEDLLLEAATSGNIQAIIHGLKMRGRYVDRYESKSEVEVIDRTIDSLSEQELLRIIDDHRKKRMMSQ